MQNLIPVFRRKLKIKQNDMARDLDVSPSYLCKVEKGIQEPSIKFRESCSKYLNASEEELFPKKISKKSYRENHDARNQLWSARQSKGIKQYEMAKMLSCSPSFLSKVEKGLQKPTEEFEKKCAKILKIKQKELFPDE